tara:strand:+ start:677 stop:904 length:228 start_codon:yes stop_codon:yes gene_type:complete
MESKAEKFCRLAEGRANKLLIDIASLSKLSNESNYEYSREQVDKIFLELRRELKAANLVFDNVLDRKTKKKFKLD